MIDQNTKPSLEKDVMDAIRSGRVHMRPRWKFILSGLLAALGVIILVLTLLFIASFGIFTLRRSGALFAPTFGMQGLFAFFAALPLILIILLLLFIIVLEILVRRYRVGYRTPLLVSVLAILGVVVLGGYFVERTRIHEDLLRQAMLPGGGLPPPIEMIYRSGSSHAPDIYRGTIVGLIPGGFMLADDNGAGTTTVLFAPSGRLPAVESFTVGEEVVVFGQEASGTVHAFGVREISD
ncbi:MAG TPA: hypothetical protein VG102_00550 [Candidatus Paceibacterota bacterium]|jgi:hypothetical protein|nr:hypothetical protein [Candidatus Paceibacterota bacterium]